MSEDQTMSAEEFQNQYFDNESEGLEGEMEYDLETGLLGEDDELANLHTELNEAREQLVSIRDFIRFSVTQLRNYDVVVAQGTTDEFAEASAIVLHSLSLDWSANEQILDCRLTTSEKQLVLGLLEERIAERKPLSYLINLSYFCDLPFYVDERVLIPRSPIAELIRQQFHPYFEVTELAKPLGISPNEKSAVFYDHGLDVKQLSQPERILDLCTGSGCIAIALATRFVDALVDAVDIDKGALEVAMVNVDHHDLGHQVNVIESDLFAKIPAENQYELIVTNPPYVDAAIMADLPPEFLYEPEHALAAGQDGLDLVHRILFEAPDYLSPDGLLICEVGDSEWALKQAYPEIQFDWLKFAHGGHGVFAITYDELMTHRQLFAAYVQLLDSSQ
ncbi:MULTISPECIES: 50S ribosomal protein L3 N(5)-glutamine methyltransferase [unclassified Psychrobacter]|uniref:50S ribosomal protein L3 N(5)-glutamine methyltransferase n=1 Tax=unclassified Psychrobacter TaxID=196806 RepID=UPI0025B3CD1D|nr:MULTISPECIES: 50S ribosomal protein L3 N(5)-glutamine methyltransferase [unclassified Psychrobacter]MDN3453622.1 50S ribosomal protein L3 N(5)-glutamine methyltransferase [Psychrobacter sp. APC 3350]MDN3501120.1 50S ribosomal protein L3 N(5)-glutamine methyltransferase [Psychrobacter sp. 5A.1]